MAIVSPSTAASTLGSPRLRRKLHADGDGQEVIKTVYGAGYMLVAKVEWEWGGRRN